MEALLSKAEMHILNLFSKPDSAAIGHMCFVLFCKWAYKKR